MVLSILFEGGGDAPTEGPPASETSRLLSDPPQPRGSRDPDEAKESPVPLFENGLWDDLRHLRPGSIPQSAVVALCNALACGLGAYVYYVALESSLEFLWRTLPERFVADAWPEWVPRAFYVPLVGLTMSLGLGLTVVHLGEPGDLAYTIACVHKHGFVHLDHVAPMVVSSLFSIVGGGSLGPEAPLVAICAALGGNISFYIFRSTNKNVMRKHTLMGMSAALAAFFGSPLGGSLFALEVCSKFGIEYFEHTIECIFCGLLSMVVFRACTGEPSGPVWSFPTEPLAEADTSMILAGCGIGLLGAGVAYLFVRLHWHVISVFENLGLLADTRRAVWRALLGGAVICTVGMFIPHTLFWGEAEFQTLWNLEKSSTLPHVFPTHGLIGFEMDSFAKCLLVGFAKLVTISFSVAGGYRGGFIFPFFSAGAAFGRAVLFLFPTLSPTATCLCFAAGINVAITKTAMATALILSYLSGEQNALPSVLGASLVSLLASGYMPFIKTQASRSDQEIAIARTQQHKQEVRARFRNVVRRMQSSLISEPDDSEEEDVPLSETAISLRRHTMRGYLS